ncbi:MAG: hypothetical protein CMC74_02780 [Flavobacteriaceae bacterium]|nr:hypothetical protein [Flavobacteriaceae bacterium]
MNNINEQYKYLINNNEFQEKSHLIELFNDTIDSRIKNNKNYPHLQYLNHKEITKVNNIVFINKDKTRAVLLLMSLGYDNSKTIMGSVNIFSAKKEENIWIFGKKSDLTLDYFTHYLEKNDSLTIEKVSELSIKRMIKAGYMINGNTINYDYIDNNWNKLFGIFFD